MPLIDIGINLMHPSFDKDREDVIENAHKAGVAALIITGTGVKASLEAASYIERNPDTPCKLYFTAGIHPHEANTLDDAAAHGGLETLRNLGAHAVAIGECGLDYFRDYSPRPLQRRCVEKQLELAADLSLPLFLHEREAHADFAAMLKDFMPKVPGAVVHCFTGAEAELETYLGLGCHIGITGWICDERRGQHLAALVRKIPPTRLMIETDAPFLIPRDLPQMCGTQKRVQRNEPKYLPHIAAAIARHQGKDPGQAAQETYAATRDFFRI
jgi:TatD DNase family protein